MITTSREQFNDLLVDHRVIPVVRTLFADSETPVGIYRKLAEGRPGTFLLESAEHGGIWSRYSFIGVSSFGVLTQSGDASQWQDYGLSGERAFGGAMPTAPLEAISALTTLWATPHVPGYPPLTGGLVGFVGWEAVRQIERLPDAPPADYSFPGQSLSFASEVVVVDHKEGTVMLVVAVLNDGEGEADAMWGDATERLESLQSRLAEPAEAWLAEIDLETPSEPKYRSTKAEFSAAVDRSRQLIHDGEVFQVVISQRFDHEVTADPIDVYRVLRALNPSPYMFLLALEDTDGVAHWVVGASPEALVKVQGDRVFTRPIAGSRPRGDTPDEDQHFAEEMLDDPKERAEHIMLVDLARNDLQKVCLPGTVEVTEFMQVDRFSHIMHMASSVEGRLDPRCSPLEVFTATFPAGTLSGAPKPRALQVIDELEPAQRGLYGGVVGYFDFAGNIDLAIAIRSATISGGMARVQAGAGLVADSEPESEFTESENKAAAPLRAIAIANAMRRVV